MSEKLTPGDDKDLEKLKDRFAELPSPREMHISRVPKTTYDSFKELADNEFAGDYGMTLKWLLDREEIRDEMYSELSKLTERVRRLESVVSELNDSNKQETRKGNTLQS